MDPEVRSLLERARRAGPAASVKERLRTRVLAAGVGAVATTATTTAMAAAKASVPVAVASGATTASLLSTVLAPLALGALLGTAMMAPEWRGSPRGEAAPRGVNTASPRSTPAAMRIPPAAQVRSAEPVADASAFLSSAPPTTLAPPRHTPDAGVPSIQRETSLLGEAQRALARGDAAGALHQLERYDSEFPAGVLGEEAAAARVLATCASGTGRGERALNAFAARYPSSPLLQRARAACRSAGSR